MSTPMFRAPGMRWPVPNFFTCLGLLGFGLTGWAVFTAMEEEQALNVLFRNEAHSLERIQSAELWAKQGAEGIPRLREALASPNAKTREFGLLALIYMPEQHARLALPDALPLCDDPHPLVQANALVLVGILTDAPEEFAQTAASRLLSSEPKLHEAASRALQNLGPAAVPAIVSVLPQTHPDIQELCLYLLVQHAFDEHYGHRAKEAISQCLQSSHRNVRWRAFRLVSAMRPLDSQEVLLGLRDPDSEIVKLVLNDCRGQRHDSHVLTQLAQLLNAQPSPRVLVLEAISDYGPLASDLFPAISRWTDAENPAIRRAAARTLASIADNPEKVRPILERLVLDLHPEVAGQAGMLLAEIAPHELPQLVRDVLLPRLQSGKESLQLSAAAALAGMPSAAASEQITLIRLLSTESSDRAVSPGVQFALAEALGNMGPIARNAAPALLGLIQRTSPRDPRLVVPVTALGKIGANDPDVLKALIQLHEQTAPQGDRFAGGHGRFSFRNSHLSVAVMEALGQLGAGDLKVIGLLRRESLQARSAHVRVAALRAIAQLERDAPAAMAIYSLALHDVNLNVRSAACLLLVEHAPPEEIVMDLVKLLKDPTYFVRILAAHSLAKLGPNALESLPALSRALNDPAHAVPYGLYVENEEDSEGEHVAWNLFDRKFHDLNRSSVHAEIRFALPALQNQLETIKTAQRKL